MFLKSLHVMSNLKDLATQYGRTDEHNSLNIYYWIKKSKVKMSHANYFPPALVLAD